MSTQRPRVTDRQVKTTLSILDEILDESPPVNFCVRLWDGTEWTSDAEGEPCFTVSLNNPGAMKRMFLNLSDLALAEAYIFGDFDVDGNIYDIFEIGEWVADRGLSTSKRIKLGRAMLSLPSSARPKDVGRNTGLDGIPHSKKRDRSAVRYHYDISNDFYSLWLDDKMVYSCGYFDCPDGDLDCSQEQKMDYVCRKLRLKPGETLLDIGCGWGALVMHAARYYSTKALGITLSQPQADLATERIKKEHLEDFCSVEVCDYRDVYDKREFDKIVSVGMFEHVGEALLPVYFEKAYRLLKPGGVFLNHGIASVRDKRGVNKAAEGSFISKYVFPDGELVPINRTLELAEQTGFEIRDLESMREHYALTLEHWLRRLEENREAAIEETDEVTFRIWQLFLAISVYGFKRGHLNIYQALLVKPENGSSGLPLRREDWYQ